MASLRRLLHRLIAITFRGRADSGLDDEIGTHLSLLAAEFERRGLPPAEARRAARRAFGGVEQMKEVYRERRGIPALESLFQDARHAVRTLRRNPGFAVVAVLTLALGIGANSALFSVIDALMLRKLPVDRPDDLVIFTSRGDGPNPNVTFSYPLFQDFRDAANLFTGIAASGGTQRRQSTLSSRGAGSVVEAVDVEAVSGNFFAVVGVHAVLGRTLMDDDDRAGSPQPVIVLSHRFWQRRFGGRADVVGSQIAIDGVTFTVIGVAAEGFHGFEVGDDPDVWWPLQMIPQMGPERMAKLATQRNSEWLLIVGRLKPDADRRAAQAQMSVVLRRDLDETLKRRSSRPDRPIAASERQALLNQRLELESGSTGSSELRIRFTRPLLVLTAGVGAVLLIMCANIANLLLARAAARRQEISIRLAIGAGRRRLVRQLLTESIVLSTIGGVVGLGVAVWVSQLLVSFVPDPDITLRPRLDGNVLLFTAAISTVAGVIFGLGPAFSATAPTFQATLVGARSTPARRAAVTNALVVSQVALSVIVLLGAGLFVRTVKNLQAIDLGFEQEQLTVFRVALPPDAETPRRTADYREIVRRLDEEPDVTGASFSFFGLLSNMNRTQRVRVPGYVPAVDESMRVQLTHVEPSYFGVTGIRILDGRPFTRTDETTGRRVAIVDRTMERRYFGGSAVGKRFSLEGPSGPEGDPFEIIGVAGDVKYRNVREDALSTIYTLVDDTSAGVPVPALIEIRTSPSAGLREQTIMRVVHGVEPRAVVTNVATMTQVLDRAMAQERLLSTVASLFALLALTVAAIGLYGVRSFAVASRTREFGVRMALGASHGLLVRSLLTQGMVLVTIGVGLGIGRCPRADPVYRDVPVRGPRTRSRNRGRRCHRDVAEHARRVLRARTSRHPDRPGRGTAERVTST